MGRYRGNIYRWLSEEKYKKIHGAAFIFEEEDKDFYLNMNKRSSIFTAEVVVIAKAIQKYEGKDTKKIIF